MSTFLYTLSLKEHGTLCSCTDQHLNTLSGAKPSQQQNCAIGGGLKRNRAKKKQSISKIMQLKHFT
ncbi:unnamed protein product [Prunus armeniaca]|uniref:Uncharacterized protein n=1 Tax=Prunus armeniaca TaxID=36596 RepID=A0A6J5XW07_PRUAR|nr:unnamed protein product [Prunus armeniaca]